MKKKSLLTILIFIIIIVVVFIIVNKNKPINHSSSFQKIISVDPNYNQQGLAINKDSAYVGYDIGDDTGKIIEYDLKSRKIIKESKALTIGHTADIGYYNNRLYVANGGGKNKAKIYVVDFEKGTVEKTIDVGKYGNAALLAIKKNGDIMLHTSQSDKGEHIFTLLTNDGEKKSQFKFKNIGVPQGMDYSSSGDLYFYTNDLITVIDSNNNIIDTIKIDKQHGESEGIAIYKNDIVIGYSKENRLLSNKK